MEPKEDAPEEKPEREKVTMPDKPSCFYVTVNGQVESGEFAVDDLYVRYCFSFGSDWSVVDGVETGLTQVARKAPGPDKSVVWNYPIDISFKSINAFGWPRLCVSVYGLDAFGRDVIRGYASILIPCSNGEYQRTAQVYVPVPSSLWQRLMCWVQGTYPEFYDPTFVAKSENREVARVAPTGFVKVKFSIETKFMAEMGYRQLDAAS
ncbi:hypothetical protein CTAYLR_000780 [Chrysophaeum taylorii]|uniref:B9 domain-containing protein 1 n=1 Tax=Chrysophaeum taylorii TaxID=2483200 RepID=A0AAD7UQX4_9STRA|nr:hypothetical protein CTAYLR_000780 [Chrysophaeum taylorii]